MKEKLDHICCTYCFLLCVFLKCYCISFFLLPLNTKRLHKGASAGLNKSSRICNGPFLLSNIHTRSKQRNFLAGRISLNPIIQTKKISWQTRDCKIFEYCIFYASCYFVAGYEFL